MRAKTTRTKTSRTTSRPMNRGAMTPDGEVARMAGYSGAIRAAYFFKCSLTTEVASSRSPGMLSSTSTMQQLDSSSR